MDPGVGTGIGQLGYSSVDPGLEAGLGIVGISRCGYGDGDNQGWERL